jgi:phage-related baseplate assembly protein
VGASVTQGTVTFEWSTSTNAYRYHLMVCTSSALDAGCLNPDGGAVGIEPSPGVTTAAVSLTAGTWYWAVRAIRSGDVGGWGSYSSSRSLVVSAPTTPPAAPPHVSPSSGASVTQGTVTFEWGTSTNAYRYHLMVCTSSALDAGCLDPDGGAVGIEPSPGVTTAAVSLTAGTWYWAVRAIRSGDVGGWGSYSSSRSLIVSAPTTPPAAPPLVSPSGGASVTQGTVTFEWSTSTNAYRYHLMVCTSSALDAGCLNPDGGAVGIEPSPGVTTAAVSLTAGTWYWAVRAIRSGDVGGWGSYSSSRSLVVSAPTTPPAAPPHVSPSSGASVTQGTVTFEWSTSTNAYRYHLMVCTSSALDAGCLNPDGGAVGIEPSPGVTTAAVSLTAGTWYWAVRAIRSGDVGGWGSYSSSRSLIVSAPTTPPAAPPLVSPSGGASVTQGTVTFEWSTSTNAYRYHLMVCTSSALDAGCLDPDGGAVGIEPSPGVTTAAVSLTAGTWYWAVRAIRSGDVGGWGSYSSSRSLIVSAPTTPPAAPPLVSPSGGASVTQGTVTFEWSTSTNAYRYHLMVCTSSALDAGCLNPDGGAVGIEPSPGVTTAAVSLTAGTWYWAVRAIRSGDVGGWGSYSSSRSLIVSAPTTPPAAPPLVSPSGGASVTQGTVTFEWSTSTNAYRYHLMVCTSSALDAGCLNPDGGAVGIEPSPGVTTAAVSLTAGTWYWAVRAIRSGDVGGWGSYSSSRSLVVSAPTTPPAAPPHVSPSGGASVTQGTVTFEWGTSTNAYRYHLMVCTSSALDAGCLDPDGGAVGIEPSPGVTTAAVSLTAGTWYWAVRAIRSGDVGGWGSYSSSRSLSVTGSGPPPAPALSSPGNGASVFAGLIDFFWSTSSGAARYHLMVCTNASLTTGCANPDGGTVGVEPAPGSTAASVVVSRGTWYWSVRAIAPGDIGGWGPYATIRSLNVQ